MPDTICGLLCCRTPAVGQYDGAAKAILFTMMLLLIGVMVLRVLKQNINAPENGVVKFYGIIKLYGVAYFVRRFCCCRRVLLVCIMYSGPYAITPRGRQIILF